MTQLDIGYYYIKWEIGLLIYHLDEKLNWKSDLM